MPFLKARWRDLLVINYEMPEALLLPRVPAGVELDTVDGKAYASLVGFMFEDTRAFGGIPMFGMRNFEEVNLRFYVKRVVNGELRRGVCFVREVVPSSFIAWSARTFYDEPYVRYEMQHNISRTNDSASVEYKWRVQDGWHSLRAQTSGAPQELATGSFEEFILEHYWGYTRVSETRTAEYRVTHPRWRAWPAVAEVSENVTRFYGDEFTPHLQTPHSAFVAEGSEVEVFWKAML